MLRTVVLEPLAFAAPDRLVSVFNIYPGIQVTENGSNSVPDYFDRRQLTDIFDSVAFTVGNGFDLGAEGSPVHLEAQSVTPSFFRVLRVSPAIGPRVYRRRRGLQERPVRHPQLRFVEREVRQRSSASWAATSGWSGVPYRVVGVMPRGFESPGSEAKLWVPLSFAPEQTLDSARHSNSWDMIARLQPGVTDRRGAAAHRHPQ